MEDGARGESEGWNGVFGLVGIGSHAAREGRLERGCGWAWRLNIRGAEFWGDVGVFYPFGFVVDLLEVEN